MSLLTNAKDVTVDSVIAATQTEALQALDDKKLADTFGNADKWDAKALRQLINLHSENGFPNDTEVLNGMALTMSQAQKKTFTAPSLRQKLSQLCLYIKKGKVSVSGEAKTTETRAIKVRNIASVLGVKAKELDTLEKANVSALDALAAAIVARIELEEAK